MIPKKKLGPIYLTVSAVLLEVTGAQWDIVKGKPVCGNEPYNATTVLNSYFVTPITGVKVGFASGKSRAELPADPAEQPNTQAKQTPNPSLKSPTRKMFAPASAPTPTPSPIITLPQKLPGNSAELWREFLVGYLARELAPYLVGHAAKRAREADAQSYLTGWENQVRAVHQCWERHGSNPAAFVLNAPAPPPVVSARTSPAPDHDWDAYWDSAEVGCENMAPLGPFIYF